VKDAKHWYQLALDSRKSLRRAKGCKQRFRNLRALSSQLQTARVIASRTNDNATLTKVVRAQRSLQSAWSKFEDRCVR
jgi:hypothetical protein